MVYQSVPSSKALGKRPVRNGTSISRNGRNSHLTPPLTPNGESISTTDAPSVIPNGETRQKRTLPVRTRRGGPGVGSCDIDINILDTLKRTGESDPVIPPSSVFILTTDVNLVPAASSSDLGFNNYANERYFERPEVIKSYKEQEEIQTPEYTQLQDEELVGGRLRARGEVDTTELSDAAYEKRHRKYEAFERRQRLREKEKLQYEHYKLKERIEQLRNLDYTAFLAVPEETFGEAPEVNLLSEVDGDEQPPMREGERRRNLMLDVALSLEERYRTLLPSDRKGADKKGERASLSISVEPRTREQSVNDMNTIWKEPEYERAPVRAQEPVSITRLEPVVAPILLPNPPTPSAPVPTPTPSPPPTRLATPAPASPIPLPISTPIQASVQALPPVEPIPLATPSPVQASEQTLRPAEPSTIEVPVLPESISTAKEKGLKLRITLRPPTKTPSFNKEPSPQPKHSMRNRTTTIAPVPDIEKQSDITTPEREPPSISQNITVAHTSSEPVIDVTSVSLPSQRPSSFIDSLDSASPNHHYQVLRFGSISAEGSNLSAPTRKRPRIKKHQDMSEPPKLSSPFEHGHATDREKSEQVQHTPHPITLPDSPRRSTSPISSRQENISVSTGRRQHMPVILVAASHNEGRDSRKTSRSVLAFGVKVPQFVHAEFELPKWLHDADEASANDETSDLEQQASISLMMLHNGNQSVQSIDRNVALRGPPEGD